MPETNSPSLVDAAKRHLAVAGLAFTCAFGLVWIWVLAAPLAFLDFNYPMWLGKMQMLERGDIGSIVILGDSAPNADLIPERLGPGVRNLALGGATPVESYYQVRALLALPTPPKAVILSFAPSHLTAPDLFWNYSVGFGLLKFRDVEEVRAQSRALGDHAFFGVSSPGDLDVHLKAFLYAIKFPAFYFPSILHARIWGRYPGNAGELQLILSHCGHGTYGLAHGSAALDNEVALRTFLPSKTLDSYFDRTISLLQSRNIPVYFVSMPHNAASAPHYFPGLSDAYAAYLRSYTRRYTNFHLLGDPFPVYPSSAFGDAWHLNEEGAAKWSDVVAKELASVGAPGGPFGQN